MPVFDSVLDLIGGTPLVCLHRLAHGLPATVLAKLEARNPLGSVKDRIAWGMIRDAERRGLLSSGGTVIEPTSGNTGIGLAYVCAVQGYRLVLTMPETMTVERRRILTALGAEVVLTPGPLGMRGAVAEAERLGRETPGAFLPRQFENPANPQTHERTTGPEIWEDTEGKIDVLVAGIGTGGTITGATAFLKRQKPTLRAVGVEPAASPLLTQGRAGPHNIQGIGANFVPDVLRRELVDDIVAVTEEDARATARRLAREEGIFAGISSGAALWAALREASAETNVGKTIVVVLPDTGERYLSTELWGPDRA
jgi:cysteine synthase A